MNRLATAGAGGPQLYCYLSVAVKRNNTENSLIQSLGSLQIRPFSFFRFDLRYGEGAGRCGGLSMPERSRARPPRRPCRPSRDFYVQEARRSSSRVVVSDRTATIVLPAVGSPPDWMSSVEVSRAGPVSVSSRVTRFGDVADPMHGRQCRPQGRQSFGSSRRPASRSRQTTMPSDFGRGHQALTRNRVGRFAPWEPQELRAPQHPQLVRPRR